MAARHPRSHRQRPQLGTIPARPITPGCSARRPSPQQRRRSSAGLGGRPAHSRSGRVDRRHAGVAGSHPGRPHRPATHRATPASTTLPESFQQRLDKRLAAADTHADLRWRRLLATEVPSATADPFLPELEERLHNLTRAGFDATHLLRSAAAAGPLPDDHPAAALWWRILDQLPQTPNQEPATPSAIPATRRTTTTSHDQQRPRPRSAPPPAFGPSR